MSAFDECCVLIPATTLEDFPTKLSDADARSLLAGWSVLWHPRLLAQTGQIPAWYRADTPPEPNRRRIILAPLPSLAQIPDGYQSRVTADDQSRWISGGSRAEMVAALELEPCQALTDSSSDPVRSIGVEDFFAVGFASLQVQIMTRRLRYTSNLDEIHLQTRIVAAAEAFLAGDAEKSAEALHDVFDALAEERDHYFTSDPHLVDLTLVTSSTLDRLIQEWGERPQDFASPDESDGPVRPTPSSLLLDDSAISALAAMTEPSAIGLRDQLRDHKIGWVAGGPPSDCQFDAMTLAQSEEAFTQAHSIAEKAIGSPPAVYGRLSGSTPSDMTATITRLGYKGMIPIDFAGGTGFGDEAKVMLQGGGVEIEALTAKPIDAASDASFLAIGASLGSAIDSGEIATALLVHWPGSGCDSFHDLRRVGSWSVSLGRFWKIDRYFTDGEHPYHHGSAVAASSDSAALLADLVAAKTTNPISSIAAAFRDGIQSEGDSILAGMAGLVTGVPNNSVVKGGVANDGEHDDAPAQFAKGVGVESDPSGKARLLINPSSVGVRDQITFPGEVSSAPHIFSTSRASGGSAVTVDVPAFGFVNLRPGKSSGKSSARSWLRNKWLGNPTSIAEGGRLQNEFLEATIQSETGGISGVYSGASRGNRFSLRLVAQGMGGREESSENVMKCERLRVVESSTVRGVIEATGRLTDKDDKSLATFKIRYTLRRGSRVIEVDGEIHPQASFGDDPWKSYLAVRVAVASEASIARVLLRDKVHRGRGRRLVSPLGLLIDEADRQTLIGSNGLAFHRRVEDRFFDSILAIQGESVEAFQLHYGFDVANPIATAKSLVVTPVQLPVAVNPKASEVGWIAHCSPKDVTINSMNIFRRQDGSLAGLVRVIQTRPKACKATLRFFRDVRFATLAIDSDEDESRRLKCKGDQVSLSLASHAVADVLVVFES